MSSLFITKKLLSTLLSIIPVLVIVILVSLLASKKFPGSALIAIGCSVIALLGLSTPFISNLLVFPLEQHQTTLEQPPDNTKYIAVLSGGQGKRLLETLRLWHKKPEMHLITTVNTPAKSAGAGKGTNAYYAAAMNVPENKLTVLSQAYDTEDEIAKIKRLCKNEPVLIISSATHLPRVTVIANRENLNFTLSASDFRLSNAKWWRVSTGHLLNSDIALHEYLGLIWLRLKSSSDKI